MLYQLSYASKCWSRSRGFETHAKLLASRQSLKVSTSRADAQPVNLTRDKQSYDTSAMIQLRLRFYLNCRPLGYGGSGVLLRLRRDGRLRLPRACANLSGRKMNGRAEAPGRKRGSVFALMRGQ